MSRTTEHIIIDSVEQVPSFERIKNLPRERTLKLLFNGDAKKEKEIVGIRLREKLPEFQVLTHSIEPEVNIAKLITDKEIEDNQLFFERCAQDYRQLGQHLIFQLARTLEVVIEIDNPMNTFHKFKNNKAQRGRMNGWNYFLHGIHCGFQNRKTGQIIEVCLYFGNEFGDLDPFFFSRFIKSTPSYRPLPVAIYEDHADGAKIIEKMLKLGRFEKINQNETHHPGVVVTNRIKDNSIIFDSQTIYLKRPKFNFWKYIGLR